MFKLNTGALWFLHKKTACVLCEINAPKWRKSIDDAPKWRYNEVTEAEKVIGAETYLYTPDYAGEFTAEFGGDTYGL